MKPKYLISAGLLVCFLGIAFNLMYGFPLFLIAATLGFIILLFLFLDYPFATLLGVLALRVILDRFSEMGISFSFLYVNFAGVLALAVIASTFVYFVVKKKNPFDANFLPLGLFLAFTFFSIFLSENPFNSFADFIRFLSYGSMFLLGYSLTGTRERSRQFRLLFPLTLIVPILFALYQTFTGSGYLDFNILKPIGTFFHPNYLGYASLIGLSVMVVNLLDLKNRKSQITNYTFLVVSYLFSSLILVYFIFASKSLGAVFAFLLLVVIFALTTLHRKLIILPLIGLLLALLFPLYNYQLKQKGFSLIRQPLLQIIIGESEEEGSFVWRVKNWESMFGFVVQKPLVGWGLGTYKPLRATRFEYFSDLGALEAHNDYMNFIVEIGIVGLVLFLFVWLFYLKKLLKPLSGIASVLHNQQIIFASLLLATMIAMSVENLFKGASIMWPLFALVGATISGNRKQLTDNKKAG